MVILCQDLTGNMEFLRLRIQKAKLANKYSVCSMLSYTLLLLSIPVNWQDIPSMSFLMVQCKIKMVDQFFLIKNYAKMLDTKLSLAYMNEQEPKGWFSLTARERIDYSEFYIPQHGFKNWNQWFLRKFKHGKRPVGAGTPKGVDPDDVIVNACESLPIIHPLQPVRGVKNSDQFWLKDNKYSLKDILGSYGRSKGYNKLFIDGTVYQAFLNALVYHRWHAPVDGIIEDVYKIPGTYFYDHSQFLTTFDEAAPNLSQAFISAVATRMVILIKADNPKIGRIAFIFVGMAESSSLVSEVRIGDRVDKGDLLGYFAFGGSTHLMLFEKKAKLVFKQDLYQTINGVKKGKKQNLSSYLAHIA